MNKLLSAIIILVLSSEALSACFSDKDMEVTSSDKYSIKFVHGKTISENVNPNRIIFSSSGKETDFYEFYRDACIIWSGDSKWFSLTDYEGSNSTSLYVYSTGSFPKKFTLSEYFPQNYVDAISHVSIDHNYIVAKSWENSVLQVETYARESRVDGVKVIKAKLACSFINEFPSCIASDITASDNP